MVSLKPMTRQLCHEFYREFQNDPAIGHYYEYVYTPEIADSYFERNSVPGKKLFAILVDDQIVGEIKLKKINLDKRECSMGIHLQNDTVKEKGYGTQAERMILQYAFEKLGMVAVNAKAVLQNTRSQHVLEKVGFRYTHEDDTFKYYRCEANKAERWQKVKDLIGKSVHVVVDRPIGYQHGDIVYPINYGYIPGIIAGDGEEQDAYILGVREPITEFDGQVIAAVCRRNDCEDKLVVAPVGQVYHQGQIAEAIHFQEQYFDSKIDSLLRKACGVIPFRFKDGMKEYLILLQTNHFWSFPKGHMEPGEIEEQTALRELYEETGLNARLIPGKRAVSEYDMHPLKRRKQVVLFVGAVEGDLTIQEAEVLNHKWVRADELEAYLQPDTYLSCKGLLE